MIQITKAYKNHLKKGWLTTLVIFYQQLWGETWGDTLCLVSDVSVSLCAFGMLPAVGTVGRQRISAHGQVFPVFGA